MKPFLTAAALTLGMLSLGACSGAEAPAPEAGANPTGLAVTNARLLLPTVAGNPAAVYFDLANEGSRAIAVRRADIADAKSTTMHDMMEYNRAMTMAQMGPVNVPVGKTVRFEPGGKHVMAFDLSPELKAGGKTEMTLTIAGGDKVSVEVPVQAANAAR